MFLGPVGDVLWGTVQRRRVRQGLASYGPPAAETDPCVPGRQVAAPWGPSSGWGIWPFGLLATPRRTPQQLGSLGEQGSGD